MGMNEIKVWAPKWFTREVYVLPYWIKPGMNKIVFTKVDYPSLIMSDKKMKSYPMGHNGSAPVYKIPLADFAREKTRQLSLIKE